MWSFGGATTAQQMLVPRANVHANVHGRFLAANVRGQAVAQGRKEIIFHQHNHLKKWTMWTKQIGRTFHSN